MNQPNSAECAGRLRGLLQRQRVHKSPGTERAEGTQGSGEPVHPDDVLAPLDDLVKRLPADEVGDPEVFKAELKKLIEHGEPAVRKLLLGTPQDAEGMSKGELAAAEAVIIANGSRPSFLLRGGAFQADHPFLGRWAGDMEAFRPFLTDIAGRVGRLQPASGGAADYNGTGTLVDAAKGLVLTNYHVVKHARDVSKLAMEDHGQTLRVKGDWVIDFCGESGSTDRRRWRVEEVRLPDGVGVSFGGLDAAVLRIAPFGPESTLPDFAVPLVLSADANYAIGSGSKTLATIGFPGEPDTTNPPGASVDWSYVIKTLFNNRFGLKRVAPGEFLCGVGTVPGNAPGHVLSHDATTFGGASGSLVFAIREDKTPAFALHFAGETLAANYAVSLHKAAAALKKTGLDIANT